MYSAETEPSKYAEWKYAVGGKKELSAVECHEAQSQMFHMFAALTSQERTSQVVSGVDGTRIYEL